MRGGGRWVGQPVQLCRCGARPAGWRFRADLHRSAGRRSRRNSCSCNSKLPKRRTLISSLPSSVFSVSSNNRFRRITFS